ncbi:hypothetical protein BGZ97_007498, partial [Linnemannia gamsii]
IEHLGEAALNLSDDEESFQERRRRKSNADTLISTTRPNYSSTLSAAPRKHSVGSDSRTSQQEEQQKKAEKARDDMKLDTWIVRLGYVVSSTTYVGYGLATEPWMFYLWSSLHAIRTMPEFVWYTCAALTGICAVLSFMIRQRHYGRRASNA